MNDNRFKKQQKVFHGILLRLLKERKKSRKRSRLVM